MTGAQGLFEDSDQGHDEAGDGSHRHPGSYYLGVHGLVIFAPNPGGGYQDAQQQQDRLGGGSLDGHGLVGPGDPSGRGEGIVTEGWIAGPHSLPPNIIDDFQFIRISTFGK